MIEKTIAFKDFRGVERTAHYAFHLSKTQILDQLIGQDEHTLRAHLRQMVETKDAKTAYQLIRDTILMSVGRVSEDGIRFEQSPEITDSFRQSNAFDEMVLELFQNPALLIEFIKSVVPDDLAKELSNLDLKNVDPDTFELLGDGKKDHTLQELIDMSDEQFEEVAGSDAKNWSDKHLQAAMARRNKAKKAA